MQHAPPVLDEREEMTAARRLTTGGNDRDHRTVTKQQGPNGLDADKEHAARRISGKRQFDRAAEAQPGNDGALPSMPGCASSARSNWCWPEIDLADDAQP